jgi:hypothetical protein
LSRPRRGTGPGGDDDPGTWLRPSTSQPFEAGNQSNSNGHVDDFDAFAAALAERLVEPVAQRVVEMLREDGQARGRMSAADVAQRLGRSRDWVYAHAQELGAVPLGDGPRPRLVFHPERVREFEDACSADRRSTPAEDRSAKPNGAGRQNGSNGQKGRALAKRGAPPPGWEAGCR